MEVITLVSKFITGHIMHITFQLWYSGPSIYFKTTHGTMKMWSYIVSGHKIKVQ